MATEPTRRWDAAIGCIGHTGRASRASWSSPQHGHSRKTCRCEGRMRIREQTKCAASSGISRLAGNHHKARHRPPPALDGEILEPTPRIRVEVHHGYVPRQRSTMPPWLVALLIIAVLMWVSPFGALIAIVMASAHCVAPYDRFCDRRGDRVGGDRRAARAVAWPVVLTRGIA
jgi:hypothetical protein